MCNHKTFEGLQSWRIQSKPKLLAVLSQCVTLHGCFGSITSLVHLIHARCLGNDVIIQKWIGPLTAHSLGRGRGIGVGEITLNISAGAGRGHESNIPY